MDNALECCGNCGNRAGERCTVKSVDFARCTLYYRAWCEEWETDNHSRLARKEFFQMTTNYK